MKSVYLNMCGTFTDNTCVDASQNVIPTSVCVVNASGSGVGLDYGNGLVFMPNDPEIIDQGFSLQYLFGDPSGCSTYRKTSINFLCDTARVGSPFISPSSDCDTRNSSFFLELFYWSL